MERTVAQNIAAAIQNIPSQASSTTTVFHASSAPDAVPNGATKTPNSVNQKDFHYEDGSTVPKRPSMPNAAAPANPVADVGNPKASPGKSRPSARSRRRQKPPPKLDQAAIDCRVEVSGYPTFAKGQDLVKVFASYGSMKVEHMGRRFAVVSFEDKQAALTAVEDSLQLCLYGQFLTVKPFSGAVDEQRKQMYKSKHTVVTVEPDKIPLQGACGEQLAALLAAVRLTQEEVTALAALYSDLERVMQPIWPGCQAMPFGSITTGLGVKSSDADCFMNIPPQFRYGCHNFVIKARRILQQYPELFSEVFAIPRANTPIVKLFHLPTKTHCDLTFKTPLGALNSKLVAFLLHADPRFLPLAVVVKYWASVHGISGSGKLTNYALTLMLIFYLQCRGLLPAVAWLQRDAEPIIVDGWNTGFVENYERFPRGACDASIEDLLGGFFKFYDTFDFERAVACPFLGRVVLKAQFAASDLPEEFDRYKQNVADNLVAPLRIKMSVCVQDPFEQCHNVASSVTPRMAEDIRVYIRFAAEFYEKDRSNHCEGLLRTILLEKPKLVRLKTNPEYRITLHSKLLDGIVHDDWKGTIRKTVFTIFERMLKLKLAPTCEKEAARNGREKEKYSTAMNKPLWKRKQLLRSYESVQMDFIDRQARITEEILKAERSHGVLDFQVILSFCTKFKNVWLSIRLTNGDVDAFYPFGRHFLTTMQSWIVGVLHASGDTSGQVSPCQPESVDSVDGELIDNESGSDSVSDNDKLGKNKIPKKDSDQPQTSATEECQTAAEEAPAQISETVSSSPKGDIIQPLTSDC